MAFTQATVNPPNDWRYMTNDPNASTDLYPESYGAVGDGVTDDLTALNACITAAKAIGRANIILNKLYNISATLSINDTTTQGICITGKGRYTGIIGDMDGTPVIEMIGTCLVRLHNFRIRGVTSSAVEPDHCPSVALLLARSTTNHNSGTNYFTHLHFDGYFQYGLYYLYNSELNLFQNNSSLYYIPAAVGLNNTQFIIGAVGTNVFSLLGVNATIWDGGSCSNNKFDTENHTILSGTPLANAGVIYLSNASGGFYNIYYAGDGFADLFRIYKSDYITAQNVGGDGTVTANAINIVNSVDTYYHLSFKNIGGGNGICHFNAGADVNIHGLTLDGGSHECTITAANVYDSFIKMARLSGITITGILGESLVIIPITTGKVIGTNRGSTIIGGA